jgi:hypothetical protein
MYYLVISIIIAIIFVQIYVFCKTLKRLKQFETIFPDDTSNIQLQHNESVSSDGTTTNIKDTTKIVIEHDNIVLIDIVDSINAYLEKSKSAVSDFHLMKDIVDRNCDAVEEEIQTQLPIPLYLGLMGTMVGICIGVSTLGIDALINDVKTGTQGVEVLLHDVGWAMGSSICGIILTARGSWITKNGKVTVEKNKHRFLTWIQVELLPALPNDFTDVLMKVTGNLTTFNNVFAKNTQDLHHTLAIVKDTSANQAELLESINRLKINKIAAANIEVYEKLKNCTDEIGRLGDYLKDVQGYTASLHETVKTIDNYFKAELEQIAERGHHIEKIAAVMDAKVQENFNRLREHAERQYSELRDTVDGYFKAELEQIAERRGHIARAVAVVDDSVQENIKELHKHAKEQYGELRAASVLQQNTLTDILSGQEEAVRQAGVNFQKVLADQQLMLQSKLEETTKLVEELQNLTAVKSSLAEVNTNLAELKNSVGSLEHIAPGQLKNLYAIKEGLDEGFKRLEKASVEQGDLMKETITSVKASFDEGFGSFNNATAEQNNHIIKMRESIEKLCEKAVKESESRWIFSRKK